MALLEDVSKVCSRLASAGWRAVFAAHGLDITAVNLESELRKTLTIDRTQAGFDDFALEGVRAIEPGDPARSLLYHAFASQQVQFDPDGNALRDFPTSAELDTVENYVWATRQATLAGLRRIAGRAPLAIVVFAYEYRNAQDSVHGHHADLAFARTGLARVGNQPAHYDAAARGYLAQGTNARAVHALPARYGAFIAQQRKPGTRGFGPLDATADDAERSFWVPLHKLFSGPECLRGLQLTVSFQAAHRNEKLRRVHVELQRQGVDGGWGEPDISQDPFVITQGIAAFSTQPSDGVGLLVPTPHPLVEEAKYENKPLTFLVSANSPTLSSSVYIADDDEARHAPEYVHARTRVNDDGSREDLNKQTDVVAAVGAGAYRALHYIDWTADGWVSATVPELAVDLPRNIPAFSLIAAPDFFPTVDQRELLTWAQQAVPARYRETIWVVEPGTLAHTRLPPNLQFPEAAFRAEDTTATAIVSLSARAKVASNPHLESKPSRRHAHLPDAAAGVFAPGWDVSRDRTPNGVEHLSSYGLGSPFPEDSKLCAALSTFWPAVAPDAARTFQPSQLWSTTNSWPSSPSWPTVAPLTDAEIGIGNDPALPWDGVVGPKLLARDGKQFVEYTDIAHADYVLNAIEGRFSLARTATVGDTDYRTRVLYMARLYAALGIEDTNFDRARRAKAQWSVLSFRPAPSGDAVRQEAQSAVGAALSGDVYAFKIYRFGLAQRVASDVTKVQVSVREMVDAVVDPVRVVLKRGTAKWRSTNV
ncbi:MAG: hypothetical protein RL701_4511 [Pseudomonadota bacterium]